MTEKQAETIIELLAEINKRLSAIEINAGDLLDISENTGKAVSLLMEIKEK